MTALRVVSGTALAAVLVSLTLPAALEAQRPGGRGGNNDPLPLPGPRTASFTATTGTWISLDVSPDGRTIVFDLLGDLYTLPIEGGTATRITEGMAFDAQPRFSPDGEAVVFVSDRSGGDNVWTMRLDFADTTQVTAGNTNFYLSPEWMPDGEHIVVSRQSGIFGAAKLAMYHVDRRAPMPLIRAPSQLKTVGAAPTPDGRHVWFAGRNGDWTYNALLPQYQLGRYDTETGTFTQMSSRYGSGFRPAVSPDGNWLVYGTRYDTATGLRIRDLRTGDERWLAYPVQRDDQESRATLDVLPGYSFTPDSRSIVVSYGGKIWRIPTAGGPATEIPFEAEVKVEVGPEVKFAYRVDTAAMVTASQIRHPVEQPGGRMIAFTAFDRLWLKAMPDGTPRRVSSADVGEYHPVWSPDGAWIAYVTWDDSAGGHLMKVRADGNGQPQRLTSVPALYYNLAWSPDGQRIVASRGAARQLRRAPDVFFGVLGGEFVWVPAAGGQVTVIAPTGSRDVAHFNMNAPDRIYAYSRSEGLVSFRWDGTDVQEHVRVRGNPVPGFTSPHEEPFRFLPRRVFPVPVEETHPAEGASQPPPADLVLISPAGGRALAQVGMDIYTLDLPPVDDPTPTIMVGRPEAAPVAVHKLTDIGGQFPSWTPDGERIHFGLGRVLFTYDLARVEFVADSTEQAEHETVRRALRARALLDSLKTARARADSLRKADADVPDSLEQRVDRLVADSVQLQADSLIRAADDMRARAAALRARADSVRQGQLDSLPADTGAYKPRERKIEVTLPRDVPRGTVVLRGGRAVTMVGSQVIENADIVITDNRIVAVGPRDSVEVPADARIIDVSGRTITPGFVDTHYHAQWLVPEIHPKQAWQYLTNLAYGVTTTRDPQTAMTDILSYADRVETGGMVGPRIYSTGPGVFPWDNIRSAEDAERILKRYSEYYGTKTLKMYMTGNRQTRQWVIQAAKELELMPTTEGGLDYRLDITHAIDGYPGIEHALPIAPIYDDVVRLFKASQTTNSPTLLVSYGGPFGENFFYTNENVHDDAKLRAFMPHASVDSRSRRRGPGAGGSPGQAGWFLSQEYVFDEHGQFVAKLIADSARAAVGSHGQLQGLGYHWELWAMASGGLSNHDALRTATIYGAEAIGMGQDLGSIQEGRLADLIVFAEDPLQDLRNSVRIQYVMKNGRLYEGDTLNEIWPRQRAFPAPPWRDDAPTGVRAGVTSP